MLAADPRGTTSSIRRTAVECFVFRLETKAAVVSLFDHALTAVIYLHDRVGEATASQWQHCNSDFDITDSDRMA
ncbi:MULTISPECIES: hypothetical protein [unclassified Caballeronia]|uniref:hypothetical protein n=1 Tax=unclassified Caballeronia TaxID=2646786 RepID=UPI0020298EE9|nr:MULTISPECIES: hypothetical protein [unclassified Caballeronia]